MPREKTSRSRNLNSGLTNAKRAKKDEFYTQLADIESELRHYREHFRGKRVFCNCDDPYESNFFRYFALNFNALGLKELVATCYEGSPIVGTELRLSTRRPYKVTIREVSDFDGNGAIDLADVAQLLLHSRKNVLTELKGDGDFRSPECVALLKKADIVVTNPPFSLFREYVAQLIEHGKKFVIIGNVNAITYKEIFPLIKENRLWFGASIHSGDREFEIPQDYPISAAGFRIDENGRKFIRVKGVRWFTNLDYSERHENLILYKRYTPEAFPRYDNYDAINVDKTSEIPCDYDGIMGVPITFLDKYNPEQFEIVGITKTWFGGASKIYPQQIQVGKDGARSQVSKLNDGAALELSSPPSNETYYLVGEKIYKQVYARILIRRRA